LNPDTFNYGTLKPGKILVRDGRLGRWFTDLETSIKSGFNKVGFKELSQLPGTTVADEIFMYKVLEEIPVAEGNVLANPSLGSGGGWQAFMQLHHARRSLVMIGRIKMQ
jgi:hypothetical protein